MPASHLQAGSAWGIPRGQLQIAHADSHVVENTPNHMGEQQHALASMATILATQQREAIGAIAQLQSKQMTHLPQLSAALLQQKRGQCIRQEQFAQMMTSKTCHVHQGLRTTEAKNKQTNKKQVLDIYSVDSWH